MGFDGLVVLMVDRTDVKVGLQCLKNGLDPSYDVVILPDLLLVASLEAGLDEVFSLAVASERRLLRIAHPGHARGRVLVVVGKTYIVIALHGRTALLQPPQALVDAVAPFGAAFGVDAFLDGSQPVLETACGLVVHASLLECLRVTVDQQQRVVDILYLRKPNLDGLAPDILDGHRAVAQDLIAVRRASAADRDVVVAVLAEPFEVRLNGDAGVHDDNLLLPLGGWRVQRPHHVLHRGTIGRVAGKDHRAHKEAVLVDHRPKDYDGAVRALLLAASELAELRQTGRLHVSIGEVEEVHRVVKAEHIADAPVKIVLHAVVEGTEVEGALVEPVLGDALRVDAKELAQSGVLAEVTDRPMLRTRVDCTRGNLDQGKVDTLLVPSLGAEKHAQLQTSQGLKADGLRSDLTWHDVLQAVANQDRRPLAALHLLHLGGIAQKTLGGKLAIYLPGLVGDGSVVEVERRTVSHQVVENVAHRIAILPGWKVGKIEGQQIALPNLTVAIAVRLVQSRIEASVLLAILTDSHSRLHLDIHRCKGRANPQTAQTEMYHTMRVCRAT